MNTYGAMAQRHWKTYLPDRCSQISDPTGFFTDLGEQVSDRIASLEVDLLKPGGPGEDFLTRVGGRNMARLQAEEIVLAEMVLLPPEDQDEAEEPLPPRWQVPSAQETIATTPE